jgi:hypothetical protein
MSSLFVQWLLCKNSETRGVEVMSIKIIFLSSLLSCLFIFQILYIMIQTYLLHRCPICNKDSPCVDVNQLSVNSQAICLIENLAAIVDSSSGTGGVADDDGDDDYDAMHIVMCEDECGGVCVWI